MVQGMKRYLSRESSLHVGDDVGNSCENASAVTKLSVVNVVDGVGVGVVVVEVHCEAGVSCEGASYTRKGMSRTLVTAESLEPSSRDAGLCQGLHICTCAS